MVVSPRAIAKNWMMFGCRNFELISISLTTIRNIALCDLLLIDMALIATSDPAQFPLHTVPNVPLPKTEE